uniref:Uncharacterized protein n=1 Tax=Myxococcus xanthus TaxID=34 RepID=Q93ND4_MYXXA|nr:unknown [Myxococcus xanthus DZF1]
MAGRWLVYALGGGMGHLTRASALARAASRRGHAVVLLTNSPSRAGSHWRTCWALVSRCSGSTPRWDARPWAKWWSSAWRTCARTCSSWTPFPGGSEASWRRCCLPCARARC